ncbi:MAG: c-type cytochrome domain-containing protein, partial [Polyangiales bacterium]
EAGQANCVRCHSGGGPAGVDLDSYANILAGGDGGPLVVPGDSSDPRALLIPQLNSNHANGPDDAGFVVILSQWIDYGALNN